MTNLAIACITASALLLALATFGAACSCIEVGRFFGPIAGTAYTVAVTVIWQRGVLPTYAKHVRLIAEEKS